eukprot:scaffold3440_cov316-Prasinococcus_capsulatus_cf.AAC.12
MGFRGGEATLFPGARADVQVPAPSPLPRRARSSHKSGQPLRHLAPHRVEVVGLWYSHISRASPWLRQSISPLHNRLLLLFDDEPKP